MRETYLHMRMPHFGEAAFPYDFSLPKLLKLGPPLSKAPGGGLAKITNFPIVDVWELAKGIL